MIRITTADDAFTISREEAQGWAEMLDSEGIEYQWEDLDAAPAAPAAPEMGWVESNERGRAAPTKAEAAAAAAEARAAAVAAREAAEAEAAAAAQVPAWVIRVRDGLRAARKWGADPRYKGIVSQRQDGSWYWVSDLGKSESLPAAAGMYFTNNQSVVD
jgi:hypothetical protein